MQNDPRVGQNHPKGQADPEPFQPTELVIKPQPGHLGNFVGPSKSRFALPRKEQFAPFGSSKERTE